MDKQQFVSKITAALGNDRNTESCHMEVDAIMMQALQEEGFADVEALKSAANRFFWYA